MLNSLPPILWLDHVNDLTSVDQLSSVASTLSKDELDRAESMNRRTTRDRYLQIRAGVRRFLGTQLGKPARELHFGHTDQGKPFLVGDKLEFNLSHSHNVVVVASHTSAELGVDLEAVSGKRRWQSIAGRYFHPDEVTLMAALPPPQAKEVFYRLWTLKEAFFKALGLGISAGLDKAIFDLTGNNIDFRTSLLDQRQESWQFFQWCWQCPTEEQARGYLALAYRKPLSEGLSRPLFYPPDTERRWQLQLIAQSASTIA